MAVHAWKSEMVRMETANCAALNDCVPVVADLVACRLDADGPLRRSVIRALARSAVASETAVRKMRTARGDADGHLLRVMREHVLTQYKHHQSYAHHAVAVAERLKRVVERNSSEQNEFIETTYAVGDDTCTVLDVLLKPTQYLVNMNDTFNADLGDVSLDVRDADHLAEIKRYLTRVFNKIQCKLDVLSQTVDEIVRQHERKKTADQKRKKFTGKLKKLFETVVVEPCSFTFHLYRNYYFPGEQHQMNERINAFSRRQYACAGFVFLSS